MDEAGLRRLRQAAEATLVPVAEPFTATALDDRRNNTSHPSAQG